MATLRRALAAAAALLCVPALTAAAEPVQRVEFEAPVYAHFGAFRAGNGTPSRAAVRMWLPVGNGPFAAVMIGHSIGGWSERAEGTYVQPLLDAGYAVIALDHFGPRGVRRAADRPGVISPITPVSDALLALKLVATHPNIDPRRIGVMGLSMGGITSELTAYEFVRRKVLGGSPLKFAAHVPFYAPCGNIFSNDGGPMTTGAPMLKLYAGKDETTPRAKCERIDALVRAAEPSLRWQSHWYPDAYHAWENPAMTPRFHPGHVNANRCPILDFGSRMRFIDVTGGERPFNPTELQSCIKDSTGYSMGYSESAAQDAPRRMLAFFAEHLRPR